MKLCVKTKAESPVSGKQFILLHSMPEDADIRDKVINMILNSENGFNFAVWYFEDREDPPLNFGTTELFRINLYIPLISKSFLDTCPIDMNLTYVQETHGIKLIPIINNVDLIPAFNTRFQNMQSVCLDQQNAEKEIEKHLNRELIDYQLNQKIIKDAFTKSLFLSYRKIDYNEALKIMKSVHNTRWGQALALWFDDFLVAGVDFEQGIQSAMDEADAVVMSVTPNILALNQQGEMNYVCKHEYPDAVQKGKKIIPVEAVPTNRAELERYFVNIPKCISVNDCNGLNDAFESIMEDGNASPYVIYLRGMAFLNGVRVVKDITMGIKLLEQACEAGVPEAAMQLSHMYSFGFCVSQDWKTALDYKIIAYNSAEKLDDELESLEAMAKVLLEEECEDYGISLFSSGVDYKNIYDRFLKKLEDYRFENRLDDNLSQQFKIWEASARIDLGNPENENLDIDLNECKRQLSLAEKCLNKCEKNNRYRMLYLRYLSIYSSWARKKNAYELALELVKEACNIAESNAELYSERWQLATYYNNCAGCYHLCMMNSWKQDKSSRETWYHRIEYYLNKAIELYRLLYEEKRDPLCGKEYVLAILNLKTTTDSEKMWREYENRARSEFERILLDYPNDVIFDSLKKQLT